MGGASGNGKERGDKSEKTRRERELQLSTILWVV